MSEKECILTMHPQGKAGVNILLSKYELIRDYIIEAIKKENEISYQALSDRAVIELSPSFEGKVVWYLVSVKLDLEAQNIIQRIPKKGGHWLKMKT